MRRPPLSVLKTILRSDPETGKLYWRVRRGNHEAGEEAGQAVHDGYVAVSVTINHRIWRLRRSHVIWAFATGRWPKCTIDHRDVAPSNDALSNLREATQSQQKYNRRCRKDNKTGFKGVSFHRQTGTFRARIGHNGETLGYFKTPDKAHAAYVEAAVLKYGEFARAA